MGAVPPLQSSSSHPARSSWASLLPRADLPWLAVVVLLAVGLRIAWVAYVNIDPNDGRFDDSVFYHNVGHLLALGVGYDDPYARGPTAQWPPAYPAALAVLYKLFGWHLLLAKGLNIIFAGITVALTYIIARRIFDRRVANSGALILAFFPGQIFFSTLVYAEAMFSMVFMLVLLLALVWTVQRSEARWWQVLLIGSLIGLAGMVRVEGVLLAFVLMALWAVTVRPWRTVARYAVLVALGATLALTPWTVRNWVQLDQFIPLRANASGAITRALDPDAVAPAIRTGNSKLSLADGLEYQITHPWEIPAIAGRKIVRFYRNDSDGVRLILNNRAPLDADDQPLTPDEQRRWRGLADRYFFAAGAAAVVAMAWSLIRRQGSHLVLIFAALGWTLLFGFITPASRFHYPLGPIIAILAGAFLVLVWDGAAMGWRRLLPRVKEPRPGPPEARKRPSGE